MIIQQIGAAIRKARNAQGRTQADLAAAAGLSRTTLNRLENGLFPDLGVKKVASLLEELGMELTIKPLKHKTDFVGMASTTASVSFKTELTPDELVHALLSGKVESGKHAHMIVLLEEAPSALLKGLLLQASAWAPLSKIHKNLEKISTQVGLGKGTARWQTKIA